MDSIADGVDVHTKHDPQHALGDIRKLLCSSAFLFGNFAL
jgi:hypothetical protein